MKIKKGITREPVPEGAFPARCYKSIHFGTIPDTYNGEAKLTNKLRLDWEMPTETKIFDEDKGPQPLSISKDYTASFNEKSNLYRDLSSWLGNLDELDEFEINDVIGKDCLITVRHKVSGAGNTYAYVASISPMPKGIDCPPAVNPPFIWDYEEYFDDSILQNMHEYFQDKIKSSLEYKAKMEPVDMDQTPMPSAEDDPGAVYDDDGNRLF